MDQKPQILIVEDDEKRLLSACHVLETAGFAPVCARTGREAARLAIERPFDLALVDQNLPDASAGEVCRNIKAAQSTFVVMLSARLQGSESSDEELEPGLDGLIIAPLSDRELLAQVRVYLRIHQTQADLRSSKAMFQSFVDQASEGIMMVDEQGVIVEFNSAMEQITGLLAQQALGQTAWDFQFQLALEEQRAPALYDRIKTRWLETIQTGQSSMLGNPVGAIFRRADGSLRFVSQSLFPIKTEAGFRIGGIARDITEQKQAQEALRESEENFRTVFENNTVGLYRTTPDGRILMANSALLHMLGLADFADLAQRNLEDDYFNTSYPRSAFIKQIESQGEVKGLETAWKKEDGSYVYVLESARVVHDQAGKVLYYEGTVEDITERKKAEQAVRLERDRAQLYLNSADFILAVANLQDELIMINQPGCRMLGYSADELVGKDWVDAWVPVRLRDEVRTTLRQYAAGEGEAKYHENLVVTKSGEERTVAWQNTVLKDEQGNVIGLMAAGMDITERKQAEQALEWERYLMNSLMDNFPDKIYFKDAQSHIIRSNQAFDNYFETNDPNQLIGKTDFDLFGEEHARAAYADEQAIILSGHPVVNKEEKETFRDGHVSWVSTTKLPLRDIQGHIVGTFGISRDITGRKQAEEALRQSEEHYHSLFENASFGIFHSLPEGRFLRANPALASMLGYSSPEELIATVTDIRTQLYTNPNRHAQTVNTVLQQDDWLHAEDQYRRRDGSLITASLAVRRVTNPDGTLAYLEGFVEDITQRKRIENELRLDEKRLEGLLDISQHTAEGIDQLLEFAVRQALDLTGSRIAYLFSYDDQKQELTLNLRSIETADGCGVTYPKNSYRLDEVGLGGEPIRQRKPVLLNDFQVPDPLKRGYPEGHIRIERFLSIPIFSQERIVAVMAVANKAEDYDQPDIRQITLLMNSVWRMVETKQAEERLRESEERLRFALEAGNDGLWDHDAKMGRNYYSPRYYSMLGYQPDEFKASPTAFEKLVHPEDFARVQQALDEYNSGLTEKYEIEFRMLAKSGEVVWILSRAKAVEFDPQGRPWRLVGTHTDITERKQAEEALRASEQRFRTLFEQAAVGVALLETKTGRYLRINQKYCDFLGYTMEEMLNLSFQNVTFPEDRQENLDNNALLVQGKIKEFTLEKRYVRKDGAIVWGLLTASPLWKPGETPDMYVHIAAVQDITQRKQAEEAVRENEMRLREAERMAHLGSSTWDVTSDTTYWSDEMYRITGRNQVTPLPKRAERGQLYTPESWARLEPALERALNVAEPYDLELDLVRADGAVRQVHVHGEAETGVNGQVMHLHGTVQDITELRLAQENLRQTNQLLNALVEAAPLGISAFDRDGRLTLWSPACERLFGWTKAEVLGQELPIIPDEKQQEVRQQIRDEMAGIQRTGSVNPRRRKDGTFLEISLSTAPLRDAQGKITGSMAIYENITQRLQVERTLQESEARLVEAQAIAHVGNWELNLADQKLWASAEAFRIYGLERTSPYLPLEQVQKLPIAADRPRLDAALARLLRGQGPYDEEFTIQGVNDEGQRVIHSIAHLACDDSGRPCKVTGVIQDITQRKQAEQALRESETKFRAIFENSRDAIDVTFNGIHSYVNPAFLQLFGYHDDNEVIGQPILEQVAEKDRAGVIQMSHARTRGENVPGYYELRGQRRDGSQFDMEVKADTYELQGKRYTLAVMRDVTERRQAEETLRRSEERYRMLAENMTDTVWMFDMDLKYTYISPSMVRRRGYTLEEINSIPKASQASPETFARAMQIFRETINPENLANPLLPPRTVELEIYCKDGSSYWSENTYILVHDKDGKPAGILGSGRDITERKRTEQALRESEQRFRSFIEESAEGVMILDEEGRIIEWNASSERITGVARQQAVGNYYWDMQDHFVSSEKHSQQIIDRTRHAMLRALRTGQSAFFNRALEAEIIGSNGERHFIRQTVFPIKTEKGFRLGGVSQDITEVKQAEALRVAKDAAEAANRSKSEFLANMSHELRTPLNAVIGFSDMLSQQYYGPLTVKQVEYVNDIHESATYLLALINDILDLSKIEAGRMELSTSKVDLQDVFDHSLVMVRERAAKHALYLSSYIDPRLAPLTLVADERKVRQILYNLLANAVKFTPDGGAVDVSARLVDEVESQGHPWVEISVTDTGIGLAPEDLERVFEAFYQVKSPEAGKTPGTGLGLSLVRRMVELHGGKVWAESKGPGWGSRFIFTLPAGQPGGTL